MSDATDQPQPDEPDPPGPAQDELHRKFREALDRKQARSAGGQGAQNNSRRGGVGPASNDKTKRQFRRKSGG